MDIDQKENVITFKDERETYKLKSNIYTGFTN